MIAILDLYQPRFEQIKAKRRSSERKTHSKSGRKWPYLLRKSRKRSARRQSFHNFAQSRHYQSNSATLCYKIEPLISNLYNFLRIIFY